ncbi:MAG: APC family permease [Syntrophothermus sp.]|uniref:APC family permease n=1 Tax=Syntrophothermus sp. TaxID=2736299 RepID=UPI00257F323B|nr:APC family permease [Syntrophothermus sp.]NSW81923.1 APC family permease [Syntrophothermus sp.]
MINQFIRWVLGKKLENERLEEQKFNVFWGTPILASDTVSSVAYAVEEILWVLVPVVGMASYLWMSRIAVIIILLLVILTLSYRQTVAAYPNGGGAYVVAKDNLNTLLGLVAGASLAVDYTLTVAVSTCAGTAAITSAFPHLFPHRVLISVIVIVLLAVGNLRGIRESSRVFSVPTYAFVIAVLALIVAGIWKHHVMGYAHVPNPSTSHVSFGTQAVTFLLLLRAFSAGCAALTGVEAVSNAVPNFEKPTVRNARVAYILMALAVASTFGGVAYLASIYHAVPDPHSTVIAQIATDVFGRGGMFYFIQATTALILVLAANTSYSGFPMLLSVMALDGYAPRQLALRGHRLNYNNGILLLSVLAIILVVAFQGDTHLLIPLYALGVFTSFTLSQFGMLMRWLRSKPAGWLSRALINGLGAVATFVTVVILSITKFTEGAWIVLVVVPLLMLIMIRIKRHYLSVAAQLDIPNDELERLDLTPKYSHHVIVPIDSLNKMTVKALRYAKTLTPNVVAFHLEIYKGEADKLRKKWTLLKTDIPLIIRYSPYREIIRPLVEYIDSEEHASRPGDVITILLPQFFVSRWWELFLHNNTSLFIANAMFHKRDVVVSIMPFYIQDL